MRISPVAILGVSVALMGAIVLGLWMLGSSAAERKPFSSLEAVPRDVDFYMAVNAEPSSSQWIAFASTRRS